MERFILSIFALLLVVAISIFSCPKSKEITKGNEDPMHYITAFAYGVQDEIYESNCTGWSKQVVESFGVDSSRESCEQAKTGYPVILEDA